ncbi:MAG: hypothetical protein ACE5F1_13080, partial [Planctomycetota bacterium]
LGEPLQVPLMPTGAYEVTVTACGAAFRSEPIPVWIVDGQTSDVRVDGRQLRCLTVNLTDEKGKRIDSREPYVLRLSGENGGKALYSFRRPPLVCQGLLAGTYEIEIVRPKGITVLASESTSVVVGGFDRTVTLRTTR